MYRVARRGTSLRGISDILAPDRMSVSKLRYRQNAAKQKISWMEIFERCRGEASLALPLCASRTQR
jgi:hypothetical protein